MGWRGEIAPRHDFVGVRKSGMNACHAIVNAAMICCTYVAASGAL